MPKLLYLPALEVSNTIDVPWSFVLSRRRTNERANRHPYQYRENAGGRMVDPGHKSMALVAGSSEVGQPDRGGRTAAGIQVVATAPRREMQGEQRPSANPVIKEHRAKRNLRGIEGASN